MRDRRPCRGRRRGAGTRRAGRPAVVRSARAAARSPARPISSDRQSSLAAMEDQVLEGALERARARIAEAREGRFEATRMEATLDRARAQIESLATATAELEGQLPDRVARGGEGGPAPRGAAGRTHARRDQGAGQPGESPARAPRAGAARRTARACRRPGRPRRPRLLRVAGRRRAAAAAGGARDSA